MGYYSDFELTTQPRNDDAMREIISRSGYTWDFSEGATEAYLSEAKWYDCDKNLREASKDYPETVFMVDGEGEESGDVFKIWAHNGKVARVQAVMTFPEPNWLESAKDAAKHEQVRIELAKQNAKEAEERALLEKLKEKYES